MHNLLLGSENPFADLKISESIKPHEGTISEEFIKSANAQGYIELCNGGSVTLVIPKTPKFNELRLDMGPLHTKLNDFGYDGIEKAVLTFIKSDQLFNILNFLHASPFWLSSLAEQANIHEDNKETSKGLFINFLLLYRIAEILTSTIERFNQKFQQTDLDIAHILLARLRYLYLAQLSTDNSHPNINEYVNYKIEIRRCREVYARMLIEEEDLVLLAFSEVKTELPWTIEGEAQMLIHKFARVQSRSKSTKEPTQGPSRLEVLPEIWSFAREELKDNLLTDKLLCKWFLAHDNLKGVIVYINTLFKNDNYFTRVAARLSTNTYLFGFIGIILFLFSIPVSHGILGIPEKASLIVTYTLAISGIVCGLLLPILSMFILFSNKKLQIKRQIFYPLVFRIPAMSLVGVLAIAGLMDSLVKFTLNGFDRPVAAVAIILFCLSASFAYTYFEVQSRTLSTGKSRKWAFSLWFSGLVSSLWLAILSGWLIDPIGLTACQPGDVTFGAMCTAQLDALTSVITLKRYVTILGGRISLDYILLVSALALMVGVFTQIFWEDKAIAEPL